MIIRRPYVFPLTSFLSPGLQSPRRRSPTPTSCVLYNYDTKQKLRYHREYSTSDFSTNRNLIIQIFLLMINTDLLPLLHRFQVMIDYWSNFRYSGRGSLYLNALAGGGWSSANIRINLPRQKLQ